MFSQFMQMFPFPGSALKPKELPVVPEPPPKPDYQPLPLANQDKPTCQTCFFWEQNKYRSEDECYGFRAEWVNVQGKCKRYPVNDLKQYYDWCGEWQ